MDPKPWGRISCSPLAKQKDAKNNGHPGELSRRGGISGWEEEEPRAAGTLPARGQGGFSTMEKVQQRPQKDVGQSVRCVETLGRLVK